MRDIILAVVIFGSIPIILRRPHVGVLMFVWISVMSPHRLTWSFAVDFHFAAVIAVATLISAMLSKEFRRPPVTGLQAALIMFVAWTGVTTLFAFYPAESFEAWTTLMKTQLIVFLIPMLFHTKEHIRQLLWVIVVSVA